MSVLRWARANLFSGWGSTLLTLLLAALALAAIPPFMRWAFVEAAWAPDPAACRAAAGACWGLVAEKHRFMLFGTYPHEAHWRPGAASLVLVALWVASALPRCWRPALALAWLAGLATALVLLRGGVAGLPPVEPERWGGLALTLLLTSVGLAAAFPLALLLALGRRSELPALRALCVGYIELVRGVPLVSLLFMASVMLPLFLPEGVSLDKLLRAQAALALFAAAYLAEVVRGGLQAVPKGQYESAAALGLGYWAATRSVILPQALRVAVPPLVSTCIGFFKDTSLVVIIGLFDLLQAVKLALNEPAWSGFGAEAYLFAGLVYFVFCGAFARAARRFESGAATIGAR